MLLQHVECITPLPWFVEKFTCSFCLVRAMLGEFGNKILGYETHAGIGDLHQELASGICIRDLHEVALRSLSKMLQRETSNSTRNTFTQ